MRYQKRRYRPVRRTELHRRFSNIKIIVFYFVLFATAFLSLLLPLRPTYSDFEKRELTKFPEFSLEALWSGDYFSQIDLWFSDTFPFRDNLITLNSYLKNLYGVQPVQVSGNLEEGDAIPTAPTRPSCFGKRYPFGRILRRGRLWSLCGILCTRYLLRS